MPILIDYQSEFRFVLDVLVISGWLFCVVSDVLREVQSGCYDDFPLEIISPSLKQRFLCNDKPRSLSEEDMLCLLCARDNGLSCATNDVRLRKEFKKNGIKLHCSLTLLDAANATGLLSENDYRICSEYFAMKKYRE